MRDGLKAINRLAANALGGAIGRGQFRMGRLQGFEFLEKTVEFQVGNLRLCVNVVEIVVMIELVDAVPRLVAWGWPSSTL